MSTRSIINIKYGSNKIIFYRHWDGYLEEGGQQLATIIAHFKEPAKIIKGLINQSRGIYIHDMDLPLYEIVEKANMGEEYIYNISFNGYGNNLKLFIDVQAEKIEKKEGFNIANQDYDVIWSTVYNKSGKFQEVSSDFLKHCSDLSYKAEINYRKKLAQQEGANA